MTTVTLGHLDNTVQQASAAAVARVLEAYDLEVEYVAASRAGMEAHMRQGDVDLFVSAWLPDVDAGFLAEGLGMEAFGQLYRPAFGWCVPEAAATGITSIAELAAADCPVGREIVAPASVIDLVRQVVAAYNLTEAGYTIAVRPDAEACDHAAQVLENSLPEIIPVWQPSFVHYGQRVVQLEDPKGACGPEQDARILLRSAIRAEMDQDLLDELDELTLGNKVVSALDHAMRTEGMSAEDAAEAWQRGKLLPR
ncbi:glycine betaine ABC transporter substrate-binding protein [Komagataeibacter rhaeticus]|uniref:Glycine/betaine ABC transporter n=1 Tax=Komagataeibacter rhaeticus TaxID=215221 RepID=A0A181C938_9PROT|nr:glycine betaine ABC transporter substrate-binding protein [Komagataeibacter rhaeticus]ATU72248.1 glycine/betaine ABC transporter [Komagataeibacter xylinus]QIP34972.1 glycine/betaine ABC transporter [Komagataeibacter rhaeticus]QOC47509.1 glycine betaine ABC transporter substrate-binding protein [Komagataeibacter rhaeticus]WPP21976.1 glycine betaine ABC transporter substrate-binding protein [Komagataeibacter rhaeticus]SAY48090.1 Substrate binding domain of ABC-type glycine betaine transport s